METWGSTAQATDARFGEHKGNMVYPVPLMYPKCGLCLSALLRQDDDGNFWAHLSYLADHSEKVVLKAVLGQRRHFHGNKVGVCKLVKR